MVSIQGYQIEKKIYNSSRTIVYRAIQENNQKPVVIKLLKNPYPDFNELLQFRNQYAITKNLNIPGIVCPYALETFGNSYALMMEDTGGISLHQYIHHSNHIALEYLLSIALQITSILHNLHHNRIIHKDIKPANILIHPETKEIKLIDFGIASLLPKETQEIKNPNVLEGTLAYISPEQTGRMNRGIDYRTDFYSLGVTLFELITRKLPFQSDDPLELVHCHIAKQPAIPAFQENREEIPQVLGNIIQKLMAKNAEDRYQSALALKYDLQLCLTQLKDKGKIEDFEIAQRDICDRFMIPEKLYGRATPVKQLLAAFERVSEGNREMILVAGFSGIGKTAVVNEVHKPIVRKRGYFIKGKFDQFNRNIPLSAFVQAFRDLMRRLLGESDTQLLSWKNKILQVLGDNAQVIIEVIPEVEQIIGQQHPAPELSGTAAQNRFNLLFQKFIQVFTTKEHPLVIFLDDLQWADAASLKLMWLLMSELQTGYLLMIGAYRDNEVFPAHPLMLSLDRITKNGETINTIALTALDKLSVTQLVADTLSCSNNLAQPLTDIIYQKTQGNPFFTTQFLKALHEDGLISFDVQAGHWQCDISKIRHSTLTDDVVEFMANQLRKMPMEIQDILKLAACIGNQFDLATLAIISENSKANVADILWKALQKGLIVPQSEVYKFYLGDDEQSTNTLAITDDINKVGYRFLHDRIQQASCSIIPEDQKQATHLKIGRLLLRHTTEEERSERIFEIVNQLNQGAGLIKESSEQEKLAQLNLIAAQKAQLATAYSTALNYCDRGIDLLSLESWNHQYEFTLALYNTAAENAYLSGNFPQMEERIQVLLQNTHTVLDRVKAYEVKIEAHKAQNQRHEAVKIGLEMLEQLGVNFPKRPNLLNMGNGLLKTKLALFGKQIPDLVNLPIMSESEKLAIMRILLKVSPAAYFAKPKLLPLMIFKQLGLSLKYGNAPESSMVYCTYAISLCGILGDIKAGYQFGELALTMLEYPQSKQFKSITIFVFNFLIRHWKDPLRETLNPLLKAYQNGLETGDLEGAAFSLQCHCYYSYCVGKELSLLKKDMLDYRSAIIQLKQENAYHQHDLCLQVVSNLLEVSENPCEFRGNIYDEQTRFPLHQQAQDTSTICVLYIQKLILCYLFQEYGQALKYAELAEPYLDAITARIDVPLFYFYSALTRLALSSSPCQSEGKDLLKQVAIAQKKLKKWAHYAPYNHQHKYDLLEAERHRRSGNIVKAIEFYDRAIAGAKANGYLQEEALANQLAAQFYLDWGKEKIAKCYIQESYYCYARWGAKAKTNDLEKRYLDLLHPILYETGSNLNTLGNLATVVAPNISIHSSTTINPCSSSNINAALDFSSILKASQTLSSKIQLDELLHQLTQIILQNSGGDRCALILPNEDGKLYIEAIATSESTELCSVPLDSNPNLPVKLIQYVKNTQEVVMIDNLKTDLPVIDPYLSHEQLKSLLCLPILNQGNLIGILYLRNQTTSGVFTRDRILILNFLCTQAAISLENARLYAQEQQKTREIAQKEEEYRSIFESVNDGLSIFDLETGKLIAANPVHYQMHGYTEEEWLHLRPVDFIHSDSIHLFSKFLQTLQSGKEFLNQAICKRKDNSYFDVEVKALPFMYKGKLHGLTILRDISKQQAALRKRQEAEKTVIQKSQELERALQKLQQTQLQMVQNEKMATLGNLVAGVAHEVNNPIGFLNGSINNAKEYVQDLLQHLALYQQHHPQAVEQIQENAEDIDLEFLLEDLPKLLDSMTGATERIKSISTSLRTFSRSDTNRKVSANLHDGIDSTLLILKYRLKANEYRPAIILNKEYGKVPDEIECFPGQLNQVFMNILANAIDLFDEVAQTQTFAELQANPQQITIRTKIIANQAFIGISDNGRGMSEEVKARIFDHLFTTKSVGKGTGLGLAIAKQIVVEKHGGKLSCNSILGKGTEFIIELPLSSSTPEID